MSEKRYDILLRLYPAEFRDAHGRDALQLIRDRARDERGAWARVRLGVDLTGDLVGAWRRHWWPVPPLVISVPETAGGGPTFRLLEQRGPRPESLVAGFVTTLAAFALFSLLFSPSARSDFSAELSIPTSSYSGDLDSEASEGAPALAGAPTLTKVVAAYLKRYYFDSAVGATLADTLLAHEKDGFYKTAASGPEIVDRLTKDIHATSRRLGIPAGTFVADVIYSEPPLPAGPPAPPSAEARQHMRAAVLNQNCFFEKVEMLADNIGYVKLTAFPDAAVCRARTGELMASVSNADALIVDLRDNSGGHGNSAIQMISYLFDRPAFLFDPRSDAPDRPWTASPVPGNKLATKPVYVLTSSQTWSAAEYFAYNLKMLKRATIVGETTRGGQHSGAFHRINDHFGMGIQQTAPPKNPYTVKGWEVIGVEPDVKTSSGDALETATRLFRLGRPNSH